MSKPVKKAHERSRRKHRLEEKAKEVELKPNKVTLANKIDDRRQAIVDIQAQSEMVHQQILETKEKIEVLTENLGQVAVAGNEGPNLRE